ncbi:MAG: PQQ-dependent sugar dehydrogenase [Simkaniaceae bacterium]
MKKFFLFILAVAALMLAVFLGRRWIAPLFFLPRNNGHHNYVEHDADSSVEEIATDLHIPWDIAFLPDGEMLVTERPGTLYYRSRRGNKRIPIESVYHLEEGGLLGLVLHPGFQKNHWIYLYATVRKGKKIVNRVERYRFDQGVLTDKKIIIDDIPGAKYHDGGRMAFGPDGYLYITTGDANNGMLAQDTSSLAGKILRLQEDGSLPPDNPFHNEVWSYGHRNSQGITWDKEGNLWSTEHGPSGFASGHDELNLIVKGGNYGWPLVRGYETKDGLIPPVLDSGADDTWAPASALYWDGSVFFGGLRGEAVYEAQVDQSPVVLLEHFKKKFGRIRAIVLGPDGYFYITTSNTDGRGFPKKGDDKILKIDPKIFRS